jgi:hypothetical protein
VTEAPAVVSSTLTRGIAFVTNIVAPTTLLTAFLFYFGYVETDAFYEYFGVDAATVQFSTQNDLLRSVGALFVPLGFLLLCAAVIVWRHPAIVAALESPSNRRARTALLGATILGWLALAFGVVAWALPSREGASPLATPIALAAGALTITYTRLLEQKRRGESGALDGRARTLIGITVAFAVISGFWATNSYAELYGRAHAAALGRDLSIRPAVVLDTREELFLQMPGVQETRLPSATAGQQFHFRYRGLRLLAQSDNRMFLVSDQWNLRTGQTLMVTEDSSVRMRFAGH